jgi:hypothetical protein
MVGRIFMKFVVRVTLFEANKMPHLNFLMTALSKIMCACVMKSPFMLFTLMDITVEGRLHA